MTKDELIELAREGMEMHSPKAPEYIVCAALIEALAQQEPWEKFCDSNCVWTDHHPDCKLAQSEQEPVAWMDEEMTCIFFDAERPEPFDFDFWKPLYATPPQRKPLSFEQVEDCLPEGAIFSEDDGWLRVSAQTLHDIARAIEAAHGIKENT